MYDLISTATEVTRDIFSKAKENGVSGVVSGVKAGLRYRLLNGVFFNRFRWWQRMGVHVTPVSPWSPIPDTRNLDPELWTDPPDLSGIDVREQAQLELLSLLASEYQEEYGRLPVSSEGVDTAYQYYTRNGTFETVDGELLYGMVREHAPDRVVQIGAGHSTRILAQAIDDGALDCTVEVFEPYRDDWLVRESRDDISLAGTWADGLDADRFDQLGPGDVVFVDSSHVLRAGNDLYSLLFEILPRLPAGVLVHFHDIFLPQQYPKDWLVERHSFLNEQYALRAFLTFNENVIVHWMGAYMHHEHPNTLASAFDSYDPSAVEPDGSMFVPNSLWLEITD